MTLEEADSASLAIIVLREAYERTVNVNNNFYAAMAARSLDELFDSQMVPDRQLVWAERAKEQFIKADKPVHAAWMDLDIADALIYSSRYEEAEKVLDALDKEEYESSRQFRKTALRNRLALYAHTDRYEELTETFNSMLENGVAIRAYDYYNLADSYIKRGEPERAAQYRDSVARHAKTRSDSLCLYHLDSRLMRSGDDRDRSHTLMTSRSSIEHERDELRMICEKMAVMEKIIERFNAGDMPERARNDCKPLLEHDRLMSETVYSLCRMEGSNGMPKVAQTLDELIDKLKDKEYLEKYVRAVDVMNNNWLKETLTELDMKPAEIELITYLYIGLTPEAIARLMEKKNALNVNTAKSKLRKRLLNKAPERRYEFCRYLNMRKGGEN